MDAENDIINVIRSTTHIPSWRKIEYPKASRPGRIWQRVLATMGRVHVLRGLSAFSLLWYAERKHALIYDAIQMRRHYKGVRTDSLRISITYRSISPYVIAGISTATVGKKLLCRVKLRLSLNNGGLELEERLTTYAASPCILTMPPLGLGDFPA